MTLFEPAVMITVAIGMAVAVAAFIIGYRLGNQAGFVKGNLQGVNDSNKRIFDHFLGAIDP